MQSPQNKGELIISGSLIWRCAQNMRYPSSLDCCHKLPITLHKSVYSIHIYHEMSKSNLKVVVHHLKTVDVTY